jgi:hypothetical protein
VAYSSQINISKSEPYSGEYLRWPIEIFAVFEFPAHYLTVNRVARSKQRAGTGGARRTRRFSSLTQASTNLKWILAV